MGRGRKATACANGVRSGRDSRDLEVRAARGLFMAELKLRPSKRQREVLAV
jgi:hypothetical protein